MHTGAGGGTSPSSTKHLEVAPACRRRCDVGCICQRRCVLGRARRIAASDAVCCHSLGKRSRSDDHRDAVDLVKQITPGGAKAANNLALLLGLKDESQYGFGDIAATKLRRALRRAGSLVEYAEEALRK